MLFGPYLRGAGGIASTLLLPSQTLKSPPTLPHGSAAVGASAFPPSSPSNRSSESLSTCCRLLVAQFRDAGEGGARSELGGCSRARVGSPASRSLLTTSSPLVPVFMQRFCAR